MVIDYGGSGVVAWGGSGRGPVSFLSLRLWARHALSSILIVPEPATSDVVWLEELQDCPPTLSLCAYSPVLELEAWQRGQAVLVATPLLPRQW
jgi:hypothetical protein